MAKFIVDLSEEDRANLEVCRRKLELRSHAETIRTLVRNGAGKQAPIEVNGVQVGMTKPKPGSMLKGAK